MEWWKTIPRVNNFHLFLTLMWLREGLRILKCCLVLFPPRMCSYVVLLWIAASRLAGDDNEFTLFMPYVTKPITQTLTTYQHALKLCNGNLVFGGVGSMRHDVFALLKSIYLALGYIHYTLPNYFDVFAHGCERSLPCILRFGESYVERRKLLPTPSDRAFVVCQSKVSPMFSLPQVLCSYVCYALWLIVSRSKFARIWCRHWTPLCIALAWTSKVWFFKRSMSCRSAPFLCQIPLVGSILWYTRISHVDVCLTVCCGEDQ